MADIDKVKTALGCCIGEFPGEEYCKTCCYQPYRFGKCKADAIKDALELLKEQEAVIKQWTKEIADNQLAHAPKDSHEFMSLDEHLENEYKRGIWDGLQIAWNIISEGR